MMLREQIRDRRDKVLEQILEVVGFPNERLVRADLGQHYSFESHQDTFDATKELYRRLHESQLPDLSRAALDDIAGKTERTLRLFKNFDALTPSDASSRKGGYDTDLSRLYDQTFGDLHVWLTFAELRSIDLVRLRTEAQTVLDELVHGERDIRDEIQKQSEEVKSTLKTIREAAAEQGIIKNAAFFRSEANRHQGASRAWLVATVLLVAAVAFGIQKLFFAPGALPDTKDAAQAIYHVAERLLILGPA